MSTATPTGASDPARAPADDFAGSDLDARITRAALELAAAVRPGAAPVVAKRRSVEDELDDVTPFATLLQQAGAA